MIAHELLSVLLPWRPRADGSTSTTKEPANWFLDWIRGGESDSGIRVNERTALNYSSVSQAVTIVAGDIAQLPLVVNKKTDDGRERAIEHPAYFLLRRRPNPIMTASTFKLLLQSHALLWGNGRAAIVRDSRGRPRSLVPLPPDRTVEVLVDGRLYHVMMQEDGTPKAIASEHVLHIKGLSEDGITGLGVITRARNSLGLGLSAEKHGNRWFKNYSRPSVILESDATFTEEAARKLLADWKRWNAGVDNAGTTALLSQGTKAHVMTMSNEDSEWLATRKFQRQEVASWFNLPPHKLGDDSRISYNSLEQENQSYLDGCLGFWLNAWQEECDAKLLTDAEQRSESHYAEFNTAARLRGDLASRYAAYQIGIQSEFLSPDDVRAKENMNKRPDGKGGQYRNPNTKSAAESATDDQTDPSNEEDDQ